MSRAAKARAELSVAELEEKLVELKDGGDPKKLAAVKHDLRYARWVARGGPEQEQASVEAVGQHTNRAVAAFYERWTTENGEG